MAEEKAAAVIVEAVTPGLVQMPVHKIAKQVRLQTTKVSKKASKTPHMPC